MYRVYQDEYVVSWSHDIQGELFYGFEVLGEFVTSETDKKGVGPTRRVYDLTTKGTFSGKSLASQSGVTNYEMGHFFSKTE